MGGAAGFDFSTFKYKAAVSRQYTGRSQKSIVNEELRPYNRNGKQNVFVLEKYLWATYQILFVDLVSDPVFSVSFDVRDSGYT